MTGRRVTAVAATALACAGLAAAAVPRERFAVSTGVHVTAAAVVDVRTLSRKPAEVEAEPPEPAERDAAEPNVRSPLAPFVATVAMPARGPVLASPYVSASFLAQPDIPAVGTRQTESPPDTTGAVGRERLMVTLNSNYVIQSKSNGRVLKTVSMDSFWAPVGAHHPFDPRVLYDPYSDRWLVSAADDPLLRTSSILYGISDTADPLGKWHLFAVDADPTGATYADFPTLGFTRSTVTIAVNMFQTGTLTYAHGRLLVLDYASLRAGGNGTPADVSVPDGFALQPAVTYSPTETTQYLVEHLDSMSATYRFWALDGTTLTLVGGAPRTNPLGPWATPAGNLLPQQHGRGVDAGDARIGNAVFRNGHVFYAQTIGLPAGGTGYAVRTAVQWVELDTTGAFVQGGRIDDPRANPWNGRDSYAFGSLAVNARNDVLVGFSEFESDDYVDAGYAFRAGADPPGTMRAPVTLKDGEAPYEKTRVDGRNRWGDYSGSQVDPSDDLTLWTVQEYARQPVGHGDRAGRWGTWWGRVGGGPPLPPPRCVVPAVVGKPLATAWRKVAAAHCQVARVRSASAPRRLRGRVVRQRPAPHGVLPSDSKVTLTVGR
jgi:hypothetical protein